MAAMPIYDNNLKKKSSPAANSRWPWKLVCSIGYSNTTKFVQMMTLGWPWPILRQGQIWSLMLLYGKRVTMDFSETIVVYDIKVGKFIQLNEYMKLYEYQRSRPFIDLCPRSLRLNIFKLLLLRNRRPIECNFYMEPPCAVRNENLFKCFRSHDHVYIWWKTSNIFFFGTKRLMTLKLGIQHWVLECYQCFHMMVMGWPWPFLWQSQICFRMLLHGRKFIQHWVLLYFQVCSNSAYPQHSQVSDTGPVVLWFDFFLWWPRFVLRIDI